MDWVPRQSKATFNQKCPSPKANLSANSLSGDAIPQQCALKGEKTDYNQAGYCFSIHITNHLSM